MDDIIQPVAQDNEAEQEQSQMKPGECRSVGNDTMHGGTATPTPPDNTVPEAIETDTEPDVAEALNKLMTYYGMSLGDSSIASVVNMLKGLAGRTVTDPDADGDVDIPDASDIQLDDQSANSDADPEWVSQGNDPPGGNEEIRETFSCILQAGEPDPKSGVLKVRGTATTADVLNSKRQVYPLQVWQDNLPRLQRLMQQNRLLGECEHPRDGKPSLDRTCIKFTNLFLQGNELKFEADIIPTHPYGENLIKLIQAGIPVDISSRGYGEFKRQTWNQQSDVQVVQRGFRCDGFDSVVAGASPNSKVEAWEMAQSSHAAELDTLSEDKMDLEQIQAQLAELAAANATLKAELDAKTAPLEGLNQSKEPTEEEKRRHAQLEKIVINQRTNELLQEAGASLPAQWLNMYRKLIQNADLKTVEALEEYSPVALKMVQDLFEAAPKFPGQGFTVQKDKGERGPQTPNELIEELISDLDDTVPSMPGLRQSTETELGVPDCIRSPRRQVRRVLQNIATHVSGAWNGPAAIRGLLAMEQGHTPETAQQILNQTISPDGTTAVGAGGAPSSAIFIFPLVRRVYPQLIAMELASIQPMDRPDGKIFFLDNYRKTLSNTTDEGGATVTNRTRMDKAATYNSSYADDPGETESTIQIQLRLSSRTVTAQTKKLHAVWSIEELQDLRAYHGLDVAGELVSSLSREIALEWNQIVLNEMLSGATAGNFTFGTTAPSGYSQKEWDEYITRYIDKSSNAVYKLRHGDITHMIAGPDAWVKLGAAFRVGTDPRSGLNPEQYAGLTLTPFMTATAANVKTYKTSFWSGVNTDKILCIRRGTDWSDTPYVWAPYIDYVSPTLTLPDVFTQKAGVMSRAAHKVVVGDAMSVITIDSTTGVPL